MSVTVHDDRACILGEGPLWHPERGQLFWFDIMGKCLMTRDADGPREWSFDRHVSAVASTALSNNKSTYANTISFLVRKHTWIKVIFDYFLKVFKYLLVDHSWLP